MLSPPPKYSPRKSQSLNTKIKNIKAKIVALQIKKKSKLAAKSATQKLSFEWSNSWIFFNKFKS